METRLTQEMFEMKFEELSKQMRILREMLDDPETVQYMEQDAYEMLLAAETSLQDSNYVLGGG